MKRLSVALVYVLLGAAFASGQAGPYQAPASEAEVSPSHDAVALYLDVVPACPRRGCWAVTYEACQRLVGVRLVEADVTVANLRRVYMVGDELPDPDAWESQFRDYVGTASEFRGVLVRINGLLEVNGGGRLAIRAPGSESLPLMLFNRALGQHALEHQDGGEAGKDDLTGAALQSPVSATVLGLLRKTEQGYAIDVREFQLITDQTATQ